MLNKENYKMKKLLVSLLPLTFMSFQASASPTECIQLEDDHYIGVKSKPSQQHDNCFLLDSVPANTTVMFTSFSDSNVKHRLTIFEKLPSRDLKYLTAYDSDANNVILADTNTKNRKLAFSIKPLSQTTSNKSIKISSMHLQGTVQVVFDIRSIAPKPPATRPPGDYFNCSIEEQGDHCEEMR